MKNRSENKIYKFQTTLPKSDVFSRLALIGPGQNAIICKSAFCLPFPAGCRAFVEGFAGGGLLVAPRSAPLLARQRLLQIGNVLLNVDEQPLLVHSLVWRPAVYTFVRAWNCIPHVQRNCGLQHQQQLFQYTK